MGVYFFVSLRNDQFYKCWLSLSIVFFLNILPTAGCKMTSVVDEIFSWSSWMITNIVPFARETEKIIIHEIQEMQPRHGQNFLRLAGLSGALAVGLGAYGAHAFKTETDDEYLRNVFDTASRYHYIHTLALCATPLTRQPMIVGPLMVTGMALFSGSCYYHALTGDSRFRVVTPYGGMILIAAWLSMIL